MLLVSGEEKIQGGGGGSKKLVEHLASNNQTAAQRRRSFQGCFAVIDCELTYDEPNIVPKNARWNTRTLMNHFPQNYSSSPNCWELLQ